MTFFKESGFGDTAPIHHSPDLQRIKALCVARCSHALLSFLSSCDRAQRSTEDHDLVFRILTESLIPTVHTLDEDEAFDCKVVSARLVLNVLRLSGKEVSDGTASLIERLYHGRNQWREAFEAAIQTIVCIVV